MKRLFRFFLLLWLLVPLPVIVWHYGPGQKWSARDHAHGILRQAQLAENQKDWARAEVLFREAAVKLGSSDPAVRMQLDIALVRARYNQGAAVEAIDGADRILADAQFNRLPDSVQREARELAGRIHYYAAWQMRLEGARRELWMEEAELARQNYRLLTETSFAAGKATYAQTQQENLESAVRLERMSLTELMGRPLPEEGKLGQGQGLSEQMAKRRGQRGDQPGAPGIGENEDGPPGKGAGTARFPGVSGS